MIEIIKVKDTDRRCTSCGACMKTEFNEIDTLMKTTHTEQNYELLVGGNNNKIQIILCKECLKILNVVSSFPLKKE